MIGDMISPTSELTMAPKAAPMITPMARSTAFPRSANFLNSSIMGRSRILFKQHLLSVIPARAADLGFTPQIGGLNCQVLKLAKVGPKPIWGGTAPRNDGETDTAPKN